MSDRTQTTLLKKLLLNTGHSARLWAALAALVIGTTLLLISVMIWWNFRELLYGKSQHESLGSTYLIIGKQVTDQNMGIASATLFSKPEIEAVKQAPQVEEVGLIVGNRFPVYAKMGGKLAMATELPLASVPDNFIDKMPPNWQWQPGSQNLPIILSSNFLDMYNYLFAPSQGLPQLSESSVKSIALNLEVGEGAKTEHFLGHVVGFSDRIASVLAPQSFIEYGNSKFGNTGKSDAVSQLILKTKDPSDTKFGEFLKSHNYATNPQNLRWSRIRAIVDVVTSATGVLALLLMIIGTLVFILFIELTIARAQQSLTLLLQVGYGPRFVSRFMIRKFLPMVLGTALVSTLLTLAAQVFASQAAKTQDLTLPAIPGWPVWAALAVSTLILVLLVSRSISVAIRKR